MDACSLTGSSGGLCVAAAGKWAVCLWSQTSASDWSLTHTWVFNEVSVCLCANVFLHIRIFDESFFFYIHLLVPAFQI